MSTCKLKYTVLSICDNCYENKNHDVAGRSLAKKLREDFTYSSVTYYNLPENSETIKSVIEYHSCDLRVDAILIVGGPGYFKYLTPIVKFHPLDHEYDNPIMELYGYIEKILIVKGLICGMINSTIVVNFPSGSEGFDDKYATIKNTIPAMQEVLLLVNTFLPTIDNVKVLIKLAFHTYMVRSIITLPTTSALGYVSAEFVKSPRPYPNTKLSMKNGYGFKYVHEDLDELRICTMQELNEKGHLEEDECLFVKAGEPLSYGNDCVAEFKKTKRMKKFHIQDPNMIRVTGPMYEECNIKTKGQDIGADEIVLFKGDMLHAEQIGILFYLGKKEITVYKKPNIGIISVVNRISIDKYKNNFSDSTNTLLMLYFDKKAVPCTDYGVIFNNNNESSISNALKESDILLFAHNSMIADRESTISILKTKFNAKIYFHNINLNPSVLFAHCIVDGVRKYVYVMSGDPMKMLIICQTLLINNIRYWMGKDVYEDNIINVQLVSDLPLTNQPRYVRGVLQESAASDCPLVNIADDAMQTKVKGVEVLLELPAESEMKKCIKRGTIVTAILID